MANGWEWTATPFGPFEGFKPFPFYEGYSANFFDGKHFVMKGGSPRTDRSMLRQVLPQLVPTPLSIRVCGIPLR